MERMEMTIDINKLDSDQLRQLRAMYYELGQMEAVKIINERIIFIEG